MRGRMSPAAALACILLAGCDPPAPTAPAAMATDKATIMDRIERQIAMPPGAEGIDRYARFYAAQADGLVQGTYVSLPDSDWPIGQRRWVPSPRDLPMIDDGGCTVVTFLYDPARNRIREIGCNGPPPPDLLTHPS